MPDVSFDEAVSKGIEVIRNGGLVWQKFTCIHCGSRQMLDTPNMFFEHGTCEECGMETCIHEQGCGLMIAMHIPGEHRVGAVRNGHPTRE